MLKAFKDHIRVQFPEIKTKKLLIACSGGVDSVVLVHLCESSGLSYSIAHCNYRLRGEESDADEQFVRRLAEKLNRKLYCTHFDTLGYVKTHRGSVQMAARELRYKWFKQVLITDKLDFLLTAHHADDALETFIINVSRGTGIEGLSGIPARGAHMLRPLLAFRRDEILEYAKAHKITWREDQSNEDPKYLRNKIRTQLVPLLKELHPGFMPNFQRTQAHLAGSAALLSQYAKLLGNQLFEHNEDHIRIPVAHLASLEPLEDHLYLLFSDFGFAEPGLISGLLSSVSGKLIYSKTHRLIRDREFLLLQSLASEQLQHHTFPAEPGRVNSPIQLVILEVTELEERSPNVLYADKETLNPVLHLRKWQKGDYFYPLGMQGRKKISKFFKDLKLNLIAKEAQWLLCSGNDIVWIPGFRADERFKVTDSTKTILKIRLVV